MGMDGQLTLWSTDLVGKFRMVKLLQFMSIISQCVQCRSKNNDMYVWVPKDPAT